MKQKVKIHDLSFVPLIEEGAIHKRVIELGKEIADKFKDTKPLFIGILNGAFIFCADLIRTVDIDCEISFIKLSSYSGLKSKGEILTRIGLEDNLTGRNVIIVEDIIDSGNTLHHFLKDIEKFNPASITLVSLLTKPEAMKYNIKIDFVGFEIENKFVIGYGLDYDGLGRNLKGIYQLKDSE